MAIMEGVLSILDVEMNIIEGVLENIDAIMAIIDGVLTIIEDVLAIMDGVMDIIDDVIPIIEGVLVTMELVRYVQILHEVIMYLFHNNVLVLSIMTNGIWQPEFNASEGCLCFNLC